MNVKEVMLESLLTCIEEDEQPCVESHIVDEIISNIQLIRRSIESSKQLLHRQK